MARNRWNVAAALLGSILGSLLVAVSAGASPLAWTPLEGQVKLSSAWSHSTFDKFWKSKTSTEFPHGHVDQNTYSLATEWGIRDDLALDVTVGFSRSRVSENGTHVSGDDGLTDTDLGLRWRIVNEFEYERWYVPTVSVRVGGLLAGSYSSSFPAGVGDGKSGVESSLLLGKALPWDVSLFGDFGYRHRAGGINGITFGGAGIAKSFLRRFTLSGRWTFLNTLDGTNVGEPPFLPTRAYLLEQDAQSLDFSLGHTDRAGRYFGLFSSRVFDGKNVAQDHIWGVAVSLPLEF